MAFVWMECGNVHLTFTFVNLSGWQVNMEKIFEFELMVSSTNETRNRWENRDVRLK